MNGAGARPLLSVALAVVAGLCAGIGGVAGYARSQLLDEQAFSARVTASLEDGAVRQVVAERTVDALVETASADLLVVRPLLTSALEALAATEPFQRLFALAVADAHRALVHGETSVILELDRAGALLLDALRAVSPRIAEEVPEDVEPVLAGLEVGELELGAARTLKDLADGTWWVWLGLAALSATLCVAVALQRRRALARVAAAFAAAAAAAAALTLVAGEVLAAHAARAADLDDADERAAVSAIWSALFGDLRAAAVLGTLAGLAVAAVAAGAFTPARLRELRAAARAAARSRRPAMRGARGAALVAVGIWGLAEPEYVARTIVVVLAGLALLAGVAELASLLERRGRGRRRPRLSRGPLVAGTGAVAAAGACALLAVAIIDVPSLAPAGARPAEGCNGARSLCDRRLNEVFFPGTHNSFAAAQQPGWLFANQRYGIARQLDDGVRALMLDIHPGVRDPGGDRVRTDLDAEGTDRNRVARELTPDALATADRLVGGVGLGDLDGERGLYLCHTLCELGAEPLGRELDAIRRFLEEHRSEVLLVLVEPYVPPAAVEGAFRAAGLLDLVARLDRSAPLPTLGELVRSGRRLVVLTERGGGALPWYLPAFSFAQDTPLGAERPEELACRRSRGDEDSPLLLVNHWIDAFPPTPSRNRRIAGRFLARRVEDCTRRRDIAGAIVAVDFHDRSGVVDAARILNARGAR